VQCRLNALWTAGSDKNAIEAFLLIGGECLQIAIIETWKRVEDKIDVDPGSGSSSGANALAQRIEEERDLAGEVDANTQSAIELQRASSKIGLVAQLFGCLENPFARLGTDFGAAMESAINRADGDAERLCDLFDAWGFQGTPEGETRF
jgi:hypothetical protein